VTKTQIEQAVNHIFDSGANEIRIIELIEQFVKIAEKETRHIAAEIAGTTESPDQAYQQIMNISILKQ